MYGTLGLWYEPSIGKVKSSPCQKLLINKKERKPEAEIHVNLWRDNESRLNFFDFGISLKDIQEVGRIFLYIPTLVKKEQIFDLSKPLEDIRTLNALFDDVYSIDKEFDECFFVSERGGHCVNGKIIYKVDLKKDIDLKDIYMFGNARGSVISFSCSFLRKIKKIMDENVEYERGYVRIRIMLDKNSKNIFTSDSNSSDLGFSIWQHAYEVTEFRFNERRSYPPEILDRSSHGKQFHISCIYYFLVRNEDYSLKSQHQNFRKMRYLETNIWDVYASYGNKKNKILSLNKPMMIYQWRKSEQENNEGVKDFIAHASFERLYLKTTSYVFVLLALGTIGGTFLNILLFFLNQKHPFDDLYSNFNVHRFFTLYRGDNKEMKSEVVECYYNIIITIGLLFISFSPVILLKMKVFFLKKFDQYIRRRALKNF